MIAPLGAIYLPMLLPQVPSDPGAIPSLTGTPTEFKSGAQETDPVDVIAHTNPGGTDAAVLVVVMAKTLTQTSPIALAIQVDYGATTDITEIGQSTTTGIGTSPTIRAFVLQSPPGGSQNVTVTMTCTDDIDARSVIIYDLVDVIDFGGTPGSVVDNSSPQSEGSFNLTTEQANSLVMAWFGHRGAPSTFTPGGGLTEVDQDDTGGISETSDISWIAMRKDAPMAGANNIAASWSNAGRFQGLGIEILGTPGTVPPTAIDDVGEVQAGSGATLFDVLANDLGSSLSISSAAIDTGGGSVAIVDNKIEFTAPVSADTTTIDYTAQNAQGTDDGVLTVTTVEGEATPDFGDAPATNSGPEPALLKRWS
ncbi:MAG: hypothetical protein ACR2QF_10875 [Geminicoccaceae bacterium]